MSDEKIEIAGTVKHETDLAILFDHGGGEEWIPKSQLESDERIEVDRTITISIPLWLAEKKGIV